MNISANLEAFEASAAEAAKLMKALANERRLLILCQIADGERSVGSLNVGLSQSALSQHLALLREEGEARNKAPLPPPVARPVTERGARNET